MRTAHMFWSCIKVCLLLKAATQLINTCKTNTSRCWNSMFQFYALISSAPEKTKKDLSLATNLYLLHFKFYRDDWIKLNETKANCDIDLVEWKRSLSACKYLNGRHTYLIKFTFSAICVTKFSEELKFLYLNEIETTKYDKTPCSAR